MAFSSSVLVALPELTGAAPCLHAMLITHVLVPVGASWQGSMGLQPNAFGALLVQSQYPIQFSMAAST